MSRGAASSAFALCVFAHAVISGCAAPGDPSPRRPVVPVAVSDLAAHQYGNAVSLTFTLPSKSTAREMLEEHPTIDVYRVALMPGVKPGKQTAWRLVYTIPSEQADAYLRGGKVEFQDPLAPSDIASSSSFAYKVRTSEERTHQSQDSNIVTTHIYPPPETPRDVRVAVTESALIVKWAETSAPAGAVSHLYHIYRAKLESPQEAVPENVALAKLKTPLELVGTSPSTEFGDTHFEFGTPYLYTVRSVAQYGEDFAESADSAPAGVTPRDIFPPATPTGLEVAVIPATFQASAYVELSWAISPETDLAGYFVYRSDEAEQVGQRMNSEILPSPAFRDNSILPGRVYYYRVSAVDRAGNESPKSPAVQAGVP